MARRNMFRPLFVWTVVIRASFACGFCPGFVGCNRARSLSHSSDPFSKTDKKPGLGACSRIFQEFGDGFRDNEGDAKSSSRRNMILSLPSIACTFGMANPAVAGLVQFPCKNGLMNTYHLMRAGESRLEEQNIWETNPLFLTNQESSLSDLGVRQVQQACKKMLASEINPSVVRYTLAANAMEAVNMVASEMKVGRNRLIPEYTYMDPRGIGKWDMLPLEATQAAVWAMDADEAGPSGLGGRPPPHDDGTPNDTLSDQVTRLTQLMSVLETACSGDSILLIFPDGTGPAVLSALIAGIPLNRVHELEFESGEVRFDVNRESALQLLSDVPPASYLKALDSGREELKVLRASRSDEIMTVRERQREVEVRAENEARAAAVKAQKEADRATKKAQQEEIERKKEARRQSTALREAEREKRRKSAAAERREAISQMSKGVIAHDRDGDLRESSSVDGNEGGTLDFVSLASLGLAAFMASFKLDDKEDISIDSVDRESSLSSDGEQHEPVVKDLDESGPALHDDSDSTESEAYPELKRMEDLVERSPIDIPEIPSRIPIRSAPDQNSNTPLTGSEQYHGNDGELVVNTNAEFGTEARLEEERIELANKAMQLYLDQDDGGGAWLDFMSDLVHEDLDP